MCQLLTPTMINEKTQLGKGVSLLRGLERHFHAEDEKSIFDIKKWRPLAFTQKKVTRPSFWCQKSIFRLQHESDVLTLLRAKHPYQVASFHLWLSGSKVDSFWKNRFFRFFMDFKGFSKGPEMGDLRWTMLLRMAKKSWKRGSIISRLSDLVEKHLSYLWIYFGRLEDVWNFRNLIFPKKFQKKDIDNR